MIIYRTSLGALLGLAMICLPSCKTIVDPQPTTPRSFSLVDTVFAIDTSSGSQPIVFQNPTDTMAHSLSNGYVGEYWFYYSYASLDPRWEFALPPLSSIDSLETPDVFQFFGASNYTQASSVYPNTLWHPGAILFTYRQAVLARRVGQQFPIYCFEGGTGSYNPTDNSYTIMIRYKVFN